jgi:UDP-N-acetylmuramyl tripeptide synthase
MGLPHVRDSRRLTGASLLLDAPGAVLEVEPPPATAAVLLRRWKREATLLARLLGWRDSAVVARAMPPSAMCALSAPVDQLMTATFVAEFAWELALAEVLDEPAPSRTRILERLARRARERDRPALRRLVDEARRARAQVLIGDGDISFGEADATVVYDQDAVPDDAALDWPHLRHRVPTALVSGTNGKTTTTRLIARMLAEAGRAVGYCCTDSVEVAGEVLDRDDYSGPGGTRRVLRHPRTAAAVLEVARGGLLRRGLSVRDAEVAVVTNIARDHLHDMGIHTLAQMAEVKFLLAKGLASRAPLVTNLEDPHCRAEAARLGRAVWWFAVDPAARRRAPKSAPIAGFATVRDGVLVLERGARRIRVLPVTEIALADGGHARHNVANALAATAAAFVLKTPLAAIRRALAEFGRDPADNRGRNNRYRIGGATVVADFGHNVDSLAAVFAGARAQRTARLAISLGQAGDRDDDAIRALGALAAAERPDLLVLKDMDKYRRGRAPGEIPRLMREGALAAGLPAAAIVDVGGDREALDRVLGWLAPGDLAVLFVHSEADAVLGELASRAAGNV